MTNAIKFTESGCIILSLISTPNNDSIICTIRDTGKGISPAFQLDMFEPFTKADPFAPGAGLGLYIVRTLASRMGGDIALQATEEGGTLFTVTLPVTLSGLRPVTPNISRQAVHTDALQRTLAQQPRDAALSVSVETPVQPRPVKSAPSAKPNQPTDLVENRETGETPRILVVDDNEIGRRIIVKLLKQISRQYPVDHREAKDGLEAIQVFSHYKPHVVLTDVSMPVMDGIKSASEMRKIESDASRKSRIYAITGLGSSDPRMRTDALHGSADLDGWLIKGEAKMAEIREIVDTVKRELLGGVA